MDKDNCKHKMVIYESYENYAVCEECGWHDWDSGGKEEGVDILTHLRIKYPEARVSNLLTHEKE